MGNKVKLEDIANELQISIVTVSNALAGRTGVSEELRERIVSTAEAMGYIRKERKVKSSASKKEEVSGIRVGVIVERRCMERYTSFYWELYTKIIMEAAKKGVFVVLEVLSEEKRIAQEMPLMVLQKQVDALIILGKMKTQYLKNIYEYLKQPMVLLDFDDPKLPYDAVVSNGFYGVYKMTNYLIREGHRNIGFVGSIHATQSIMDRYQGFSKSLLDHGIVENPEWILSDRDIETGIIDIVLPEKLPTAFVCNCDYIANHVAERLIEKGYRIPEDVALTGYDDFLIKGIMKNKVTTYSADTDGMAHYALKRLLKRKKGDTAEKVLRIVDGKMIIRESTAVQKESSASSIK